MKFVAFLLLGLIFFVALLPNVSAATITVSLLTADSFAVLAGSGITNTGTTTITGDVGSYPTTTQTGFGSVTITGTNHMGDATTQGAKTDLITAYNDASGRTPTGTISADLGGQTLTPGIYRDNDAPDSLAVTGTLTLDGEGDSGAVFIFQSGSTLVTSAASTINLINGAQACNVFWQVGSSATLGTTSTFVGTILAMDSITDNGGANIDGRLLARNAAVVLNNTTIEIPTCLTPTPTPTISPTLTPTPIPSATATATSTPTATATSSSVSVTSSESNSSSSSSNSFIPSLPNAGFDPMK